MLKLFRKKALQESPLVHCRHHHHFLRVRFGLSRYGDSFNINQPRARSSAKRSPSGIQRHRQNTLDQWS